MDNKFILATNEDIATLYKVQHLLSKIENTDESSVDWENIEMQHAILRVIHNIGNAENYFKKLPDDEARWYDVECNNCGWWGSSEWCGGGAPIADTGDYSDPTCPVCEKVVG